MALTNIFREPRREITETVVGIGITAVVAAVVLVGPYYFALWLEAATTYPYKNEMIALIPWPIGVVFGVILELVLGTAVYGIHAVGEGLCDKMEASGIQLRPRMRP